MVCFHRRILNCVQKHKWARENTLEDISSRHKIFGPFYFAYIIVQFYLFEVNIKYGNVNVAHVK